MQNPQVNIRRGLHLAVIFGIGFLTAPATAQKASTPALPSQPSVNQSGVNPGAGSKTPSGSAASSAGGAGLQIVPAAPGDANTYKLVPDGSGGFKLTPASPTDTNTYKLVPIMAASAPAAAAPQKMYVRHARW